MLRLAAILVGMLLVSSSFAENPSTNRHGVNQDLKAFPQATPKEALGSILRAIEQKRFDYLLAHLAEPEWVDARIEASSGGFKDLVQETGNKLDPPTVKLLSRFLEQGEVETLDTSAFYRLKDNKDRIVRLRKIKDRWYLLNPNRP